MSWVKHYQPPIHTHWQGRSDAPADAYLFQKVAMLDLTQPLNNPSTHCFALLGFCSDAGVRRNLGRTGASDGPAVIRQALAKFALHRDHFSLYDAGDIIVFNDDLEAAQSALAEAVALLLHAGITPLLLGGGHEIAWGHFQGIAKFIEFKKSLGIINLDAHLDMRPLLADSKGSSGTPFLQIANVHKSKQLALQYACLGLQPAGNIQPLLDTAKAHNVMTVFADAFHNHQTSEIEGVLKRLDTVSDYFYLTLCLDVFAACLAPGVSAPQPFGLTVAHVLPLVQQIARSGKVISYDIAELCPAHDIDHHTAKLAAQFIYEIIHTHVFAEKVT